VLLGLILAPAAPGSANERELVQRMKSGGHVLMVRHAQAPGVGDPAGFKIGDCATQRNLDEAGRAHARAIGEWLRSRGIETARVYSSQWCRCLETARLMGLGAVTELAPLNSFYERPDDREPNLRDLREFLARQSPEAPLLVLVTHQVIIQGLAGRSVASGEAILLQLARERVFEVVGPVRFDGDMRRHPGSGEGA
jgi:broad specificity phosphatase PhoE